MLTAVYVDSCLLFECGADGVGAVDPFRPDPTRFQVDFLRLIDKIRIADGVKYDPVTAQIS